MIHVRTLSKDFRSNRGAGFQLNEIRFSLQPSKMVAVLGTNGSGKSTLLKLLAGELSPDEGEIVVEENNTSGYRPSGRDSSLHPLYLDQDAGRDIVPSMTLAENLCLAQITGRTGSLRFLRKRRLCELSSLVLSQVPMGLEQRIHDQARVLSGGERQGLVLARALLSGSRFLLLDEFVSALTTELASRTLSIVCSFIKRTEAYCVFVTHQIDLAFRFADQLLFLNNGRMTMGLSENSPAVRKNILDLFSSCLKESIGNE